MPERDWFDIVSLAVGAATLLVTAIGLSYVVASLKQTAKQQRIEAGPYVRVDIGSLDADMPDFHRPEVRYRDSVQATSFEQANSGSDVITISAWFRNYQTHPLGMALGISAVFLIETLVAQPLIHEVRIAYLEQDKAVLVDIAGTDRDQDITVRLLSLSFLDFYDQRHEHQLGAKGTMHCTAGLLPCTREVA